MTDGVSSGMYCYTDRCTVCGYTGALYDNGGPLRENYRCKKCKASLRYREQARLVLKYFSKEGSIHLSELCQEEEFQTLRIYEPGLIGPFRRCFRALSGYRSSGFWSDVKPGDWKGDVQCQNLMQLTYGNASFDLVLTSDIFEHVRRPFEGFREVNRVLKDGGFHIFSIPVKRPMPSGTVSRVDTTSTGDFPILPEHYHSAPMGGRSLVYTDFGEDMRQIMSADGIDVEMESSCTEEFSTFAGGHMLTFFWKKRRPSNEPGENSESKLAVESGSVPCNICGRHRFKAGPKGRVSRGGNLPACAYCGSLERHRVIRRVWTRVPSEYLRGKEALQFSNDPAVEERWFSSFEVSVFGRRNSLNLERIDRGSGTYDVVICNHVLEHVEKDAQAFREIMRVLRPGGFLQFSVPNPKAHAVTRDWGYPRPELHDHYRTYGRDLVERFGQAQPGVEILRVQATDDVTGVADLVYFASLDGSVLDAKHTWFKYFNPIR